MLISEIPKALYEDEVTLFATLWDSGVTTATKTVGQALHDYVIHADDPEKHDPLGLGLARSFVQAMQPRSSRQIPLLHKPYNNIPAFAQRDLVHAARRLVEKYDGDWGLIEEAIAQKRSEIGPQKLPVYFDFVRRNSAAVVNAEAPKLRVIDTGSHVER